MKIHILAFCLFVSSLSALVAQEQFIPPRPERFTPVVDSAQVLSAEEEAAITQLIKHFEDSTGTQLAVVYVASLKGYDVESYAFQWFRKWEYGQKDNNNGILIFAAIDDRKVHIEVGYGLEGAIPDAYAKRIIENQIKPNFREKNYYAGTDEAVRMLIKLASGEPYQKEDQEPVEWYWMLFAIIFLVILPLVLVILILVWIVKAIRKKKQPAATFTSQGEQKTYIPPTSSGSYNDDSTSNKRSYSDYSDYSDKYSDYSDYSDSSGGSSGGGGASGDW